MNGSAPFKVFLLPYILLFPAITEGTGNAVVDEYGILKKDTSILGQAHHLNQDAAYRDVIPTNKGMSTKLEGNTFSEVGSPHYNAHESLEQFWNQYRRGGAKYGEVPTNLEYSKAIVDSLKADGYTQQEAMQIAARAKVIHINPNTVPSGINRNEFNKWKQEYWKNRVNDFE